MSQTCEICDNHCSELAITQGFILCLEHYDENLLDMKNTSAVQFALIRSNTTVLNDQRDLKITLHEGDEIFLNSVIQLAKNNCTNQYIEGTRTLVCQNVNINSYLYLGAVDKSYVQWMREYIPLQNENVDKEI